MVKLLRETIEKLIILVLVMSRSPLRYPGGKTRACKVLEKIFLQHFDLTQFTKLISPFFGGGSFELYLQDKYNLSIIANDKFTPVYNFWSTCKTNKQQLVNQLLTQLGTSKETFTNLRRQVLDQPQFESSWMFFVINRCSFSGATLSGGFSLEASNKRFTRSSIDRISKLDLTNFEMYNLDFKEFLELQQDGLVFLDPPYYLDTPKLYGNKGDLHESFNHQELYECLKDKKNWVMTYNNCEYIKDLYKDFIIIETSWSYGMNKSKESSEIVIVCK